MLKRSVLVLGAASWNKMVFVSSLPQGESATIFEAHEREAVGSTGVGKAMALAAMGCAPVLHCALGKDDNGQLVKKACQERDISLIIDEHDEPTPHHLNIMDDHGGRYSIFISNGAENPSLNMARLKHAICSAGTVFLCLCASSKIALPLLRESQAEVLLDLHDYDGTNPWYNDFIACADIIQLSDVALENPLKVVERFLSGRAHQVVLTSGAKGAEIFTASQRVFIEPVKAKIIDSNGAGDAFSVGLWYAQKQGKNLKDAGNFAAATAAFAIEDDALFPSDLAIEDILKRTS